MFLLTLLLAFCPIEEVKKSLPQYGILQKTADDFVYVKVDDAYIHDLIPYMKKEGFQKPPYFEGDLVGAHITVMDRQEVEKYKIGCISELGRCIFFKPSYFKTVESDDIEYYLLVVEAPVLDQIRIKYGLPKRQYPLHITIGVKTKNGATFGICQE